MQIRAGAVPEHFFFPWKKWLDSNGGKSGDLSWTWEEYPGGSGAMLQALKENRLDLAFLLTESALQARSRGEDLEILCPFVQSPLPWGIFTGKGNPIQTVEEGKTIAISRFGSGSHLMAILEAGMRGGRLSEENWLETGNLEGAASALSKGEADLFFWEKWTTKPLVDAGIFRMMSVFPGPWPAFVLCAGSRIRRNPELVAQVIDCVKEVCRLAAGLKERPAETATDIASVYGQKREDVKDWLSYVKWADSADFSLDFLISAEKILRDAGLISQETPG